MRSGFTLIELLVVVTIIVVLLALLAPALDKAIYAAELASCGTNLKAVSGGVIQYAFANRRYYPDRGLSRLQSDSATYDSSYIAPTALADRTYGQFDMRPGLKEFISINKQLVDPLCEPVELEIDQGPDENVAASYTLWWGWKYDVPSRTSVNAQQGSINTSQARSGAGMFKMGDKWSWMGERFRLLIGDFDLGLGGNDANPVQGSHPDDEGKMSSFVFKYQPLFGTGAGIPITASLWMRPGGSDRGLIDTNYDDGSVARFDKVVGWQDREESRRDRRMTLVPNMANQQQTWKYYQVPRH
jgi:prepilin-type N-terminal cleavage/methylation domain-containing protein